MRKHDPKRDTRSLDEQLDVVLELDDERELGMSKLTPVNGELGMSKLTPGDVTADTLQQ